MAEDLARTVGLCAGCRHSRTVPSRQATYWLCERSRTDPAFPKYPRLPVLSCAGFEPADKLPITPG